MKLIKQRALSLAEVSDELSKCKTLEYEQKATLDYVKKFNIGKRKSAQALKKLEELNVPEELIAPLINVAPAEIDTVKLIFSWKNLDVDDELAAKIVDVFKSS